LGPLLGAGVVGQAGAGKHQQQALRLGLAARRLQKIVEMADVHGADYRQLRRVLGRRSPR